MKYLILGASLFVCNLQADEGTVFHNYIWANYKQFNQEPDQAQKYYQKIIANAPSHFAYKGYIHHLQETNQWGSLAKLIPAYDSIFANDAAIQMIFAQALEIIGNQNAADERLVKLHGQNKTNQEITFSTAQMYMRRKEPENALKVLDAYLDSAPDKSNNFIFYFVKSQIYVQMNNKNEALKSVSKR